MTLSTEAPWGKLSSLIEKEEAGELRTRVRQVVGMRIECGPLQVPLGSRMSIKSSGTRGDIAVEVVGFSPSGLYLMPYREMEGIAPGDLVVYESAEQVVEVGDGLLGRVLDGEGRVIDGKPNPYRPHRMPLYHEAPSALLRKKISQPIFTGIRSWDAFMTLGTGQRMGIFAGTGVGKSVLMGMIAKGSSADVNVAVLVGERGNEVNGFLQDVLGEEGMKRSVLVVATSDKSPLVRIRAAFLAMTVAEYFAENGKSVMFLMDSVTRMAMAARELGLSVGEPPTAKGYPPSVFSMMPKLLERSGNYGKGSITSLITVLLEGDDLQDPIGDAVRGILDGHVVLDRDLANRGHYPAVSITDSLSRWMDAITTKSHQKLAAKGRRIMAEYKSAEDLINVGAYVKGSSEDIDEAIRLIKPLRGFLTQDMDEKFNPTTLEQDLAKVLES